jgi:hypothetical protein
MEEISALLTEIAVGPIVLSALRVLLILIGAWVIAKVVSRLIPGLRVHIAGVMKKHAGGSPQELDKRAETVGGIICKAASFLIYGIAIVRRCGRPASTSARSSPVPACWVWRSASGRRTWCAT